MSNYSLSASEISVLNKDNNVAVAPNKRSREEIICGIESILPEAGKR